MPFTAFYFAGVAAAERRSKNAWQWPIRWGLSCCDRIRTGRLGHRDDNLLSGSPGIAFRVLCCMPITATDGGTDDWLVIGRSGVCISLASASRGTFVKRLRRAEGLLYA